MIKFLNTFKPYTKLQIREGKCVDLMFKNSPRQEVLTHIRLLQRVLQESTSTTSTRRAPRCGDGTGGERGCFAEGEELPFTLAVSDSAAGCQAGPRSQLRDGGAGTQPSCTQERCANYSRSFSGQGAKESERSAFV